MGQKINIGVPIDLKTLIDTRVLVQAGSGGGKSYLLRKLIESIGDKVQQIILDPEGEFVTLREKFDFALVAKNGDIPLNLKYAEALAHKVLETNISVIIDLYELKKHERILFVKRFLDALVNAPKELWHECFVYIDEAHVFCPESAKCESADAVIDVCTRGRKRGFSAILATQRLSKLHKDAAAECLNKMIGRTGLDIDRKRAGDELGMTSKQQMLALRELEVHEFYVFGPAISNEVLKFKTGKVITTHLSSGKRTVKPPPTPGAIKKILSKLKDIPEEAEKELKTKQELLQKINILERELRQSKAGQAKTPGALNNTKQDPSLQQEIQSLKAIIRSKEKQLMDANRQFEATEKKFLIFLNKTTDALQNGLQAISSFSFPKNMIDLTLVEPLIKQDRSVAEKRRPEISQAPAKRNIQTTGNGEVPLAQGPHKMLSVLATLHPDKVSKERLSMLSGYSITSSTFGIYIAKLFEPGYIQKVGGNEYIITDSGLYAVGDYEKVPTDSATLIDYWKNKLPSGPAKMFGILCTQWPNLITKEQLSSESGYSITSSTFGIYIGKLRTLKLISEQNKMLKASDSLFENV